MKITNSASLQSPFGIAGISQLQVVGGPICIGMLIALA